MYRLDPNQFEGALLEAGYRSISDLARSLKIHRNTIHHYLSGGSVFPENLEKILVALNCRPEELITKTSDPWLDQMGKMAPIIDQLHSQFPDVTFILFGSRAKKRAHSYSDWDIGVYRKEGLSHSDYIKIYNVAEDLAEPTPYIIEVINFNKADWSFLKSASKKWVFLSGNLVDWIHLQKKVLGHGQL
jgi:predicted nucleotidyltransferase/DNA-binding Xre family transcriptional regulator